MAAVDLSLSFHTVPELTAIETVRVAAAADCRFVAIRLLNGQPMDAGTPVLGDRAERRAMIAAMRDAEISALDASTARLRPETDVDAFTPFLDAAVELGARHVLASGDDPDIGRLADRFALLCQRAATRGMTVDIEFVPWMAISSLSVAADFVRRVGEPNLGIAVDALHFDRSGSRLEDFAALPSGWFRYAQICDAPKRWETTREELFHTAVSERLNPGDGAIDLVGLLRHLPPGIPLALEIPMERLSRTMPVAERIARSVIATRKIAAIAYGPER